jgi:hypothetical protein
VAETWSLARGRASASLKLLRDSAAAIGPKPGKESVRAMLLERDELPGDHWKMYRNVTFRAGTRIGGSEESRRARRAGCVKAWRYFADVPSKRSVWIEIIPYATSLDASSALPRVKSRVFPTPGSKLRATQEWVQIPNEVVGMLEGLAYEQYFSSPQGAGGSQLIAERVENLLVVVGYTQFGDMESWHEKAAVIASLQIEKIQQAPVSAQRSGETTDSD